MPKIQMRHDTIENWVKSNPVLLAGEIGVEIEPDWLEYKRFKIGDGVTPYNDLEYNIDSFNILDVIEEQYKRNSFQNNYSDTGILIQGINEGKTSFTKQNVGLNSIATKQGNISISSLGEVGNASSNSYLLIDNISVNKIVIAVSFINRLDSGILTIGNNYGLYKSGTQLMAYINTGVQQILNFTITLNQKYIIELEPYKITVYNDQHIQQIQQDLSGFRMNGTLKIGTDNYGHRMYGTIYLGDTYIQTDDGIEFLFNPPVFATTNLLNLSTSGEDKIKSIATSAITGAASSILTDNLVASRVLKSATNGKVIASSVTEEELDNLAGTTGPIQTQIDTLKTSVETINNQPEVQTFEMGGSQITDINYSYLSSSVIDFSNSTQTIIKNFSSHMSTNTLDVTFQLPYEDLANSTSENNIIGNYSNTTSERGGFQYETLSDTNAIKLRDLVNNKTYNSILIQGSGIIWYVKIRFYVDGTTDVYTSEDNITFTKRLDKARTNQYTGWSTLTTDFKVSYSGTASMNYLAAYNPKSAPGGDFKPIGKNCYAQLSNGAIMQWGRISAGIIKPNTSNASTITFAKPFKYANYSISVIRFAGTGYSNVQFGYNDLKTTGFTLYQYNNGETNTDDNIASWIAIGY